MMLHGLLAWGLLSTITTSTLNPLDGKSRISLDFCLLPLQAVVLAQSSPSPPQPRKVVKKKPATPVKVREIAKPEASKKKTVVAEKQPDPAQVAPALAEERLVAKQEVGAEDLPPAGFSEAGPGTADEAATVPQASLQAAKRQQYVDTYFSDICQKIQQNMRYPKLARRMGLEGKVVVSFMVHKDGNIDDVRIVQSSGVRILDKNAIDTIKNTAPFPKPPITAELIVPIKYGLV